MKKTLIIISTIGLVLFTTAAIIDLQNYSGFSQSSCSSIFATCKATCTGTHIYSTANYSEKSYFPQCQCDGQLEEEVIEITYNSKQVENLNRFIHFVHNLPIDNRSNLLSTLKDIKRAINQNDYQGYENSIDRFEEFTNQLEKKDLKLLDDWIEKNTPHNKK